MVAQLSQSKNSSVGKKAWKGAYAFRAVVEMDWQLPREPALGPVTEQNLGGGLNRYSIMGKPGGAWADPARWKEPPHRNFVNLPVNSTPELGLEVVDPNAMLAFSKRYGFVGHQTVRDGWVLNVETSASLAVVSRNIGRYGPEEFFELMGMKSQALLKYAWQSSDKRPAAEIAKYTAGSLQNNVDVDTGAFVIKIPNAWTLVCALVIRDHAGGRTAVCANPECPAPYFLKSRRTQKICEAGECVAWAQRNYALKWWRENESKASKLKLKGGTK